jgi:hypothetical protein
MRSDEREELWRDVQRPPLRPEGRLVLVDSGQFSQIDRPEVVVAVLSVTAPALTQWSEIFHRSGRSYVLWTEFSGARCEHFLSAALSITDDLLHRSELLFGANSGCEQSQQKKLLDHLVGGDKQPRWHGQAERTLGDWSSN